MSSSRRASAMVIVLLLVVMLMTAGLALSFMMARRASSEAEKAQAAAVAAAMTPAQPASTPGVNEAKSAQPAESAPNVHGFTMKRIDGKEEALSKYKGKVLVVVNVASECGLTPQYEGLQALYKKFGKDGVVVLGFPANNFGGQEPGTNKDILEFCTGEYNVTFPMFEKISVTGDDQHALYRTLSRVDGAPNWNFTKYVVDKNGSVVARFGPRKSPDDPELIQKINDLLSAG